MQSKPQTKVEQAAYILERVESLGIKISPTSRLMQMLRILESGRIEYVDDRFPVALEAIRDMYQLRLIVDEMDTHRNDTRFVANVKKLLQDAATPQDGNSNTPGRDTQFELYLAAIALRAGMSPVEYDEPDVTCTVDGIRFGIAAKRLKSINRFEERVKEGAKQIRRANIPGNLCLRQRFKQDFGLVLPPLPELEQLEEEGARLAYLADLRRAIARNERWEIEDRCCLGRFAFPKIAMWQDLGEHIQSIANNSICRSIAGKISDDPQVAFGDPTSVPDTKELDDAVPPGEIKAILDCDSSQLEAIVAARKGISFVLDGPPGTGKSQTIANIIADAMSVGKRVLFVSEKVAALEVVKRRLDDCGLGDFCLECHSSKANRKALLEELKWCLEIPIESYPDPNPKLNDLRKQRQALNDYVRILHTPQQPVGLSMYELHGNIARLMQLGMLGRSRVNFQNPESVSRADLESMIQMLRLADQHQNVISDFPNHPWRGCKLTTPPLALKPEIQRQFTLLADCCEQLANDMKPFVESGLLPQRVVGVNPNC